MKLKAIFLGAALAATINPVFASNIWTSTQGNPEHTGYIDIKTNPNYYKEIWSRKFTSPDIQKVGILDTLIIKDLLIQLQSEYKEGRGGWELVDVRLIAVDSATGNVRWEKSVEISASKLRYANGKILVINKLQVSAYDLNGKIVHAYEITPPVEGNTTLMPKFSEVDGYNLFNLYNSYKTRTISSNNAQTGKTLWQARSDDKPAAAVRELAVNSDYVMASYSDSLDFHVRDTGELAFALDLSPAPIYGATMALDAHTNSVYLTIAEKPQPTDDYNFVLYALDLNKQGKLKWFKQHQNSSIHAVIADNEVYSVQDGAVNAYDAETGYYKWSWKPEKDSINPSASPGMLATTDTLFIVGDKYIYAVSRFTHQVTWKTSTVGNIWIGDNKLFIKSGTWENPIITAFSLS